METKVKSQNRKINDEFTDKINPHWNILRWGDGKVSADNSILEIRFKHAEKSRYSNMQIDDYSGIKRKNYLWRAPLTMTVKARFIFDDKKDNKSGDFKGTAGFGFWNNPFSVNSGIHALPEAIWFFYATKPSSMILKNNGLGDGWKAQTIHSVRATNILNAIPTSLAVLLAKLTNYTKYSLNWIEKFSGVQEVIIKEDMSLWHTYKIEWNKDKANFYVDDSLVMTSHKPPTQPLGFVAWIDNQYSVVTPQGLIKFGTTDTSGLTLEIDNISINANTES